MNRLRYTFLLLIVCGIAAAQAPTSVADGKHFRIVCHFDNELPSAYHWGCERRLGVVW